ncbi:transposon Ty3-I Gag-Pol polyprotein [Trichonephila clavipes]|nr:transposon Ty3-I Gag-Pol polyprotein [Trichonephila clavipes]
MDDVVIPAANESEALEYLKIVLEVVDHLGPLATTSKKYKHVFAVIDAFSKFTWLYPTRSTDAAKVTNRFENQRHVFGNLKSCQDIEIVQLLNDKITAQFQQQCDALRQDAKKQIYKVQDEIRRTNNLRRRRAHKYQLHDLAAIKRTQFGPGLKLKQKYIGPYKDTKVKHNDTYDVEKCDFADGPSKTSTCAEFMKLWPNQINST